MRLFLMMLLLGGSTTLLACSGGDGSDSPGADAGSFSDDGDDEVDGDQGPPPDCQPRSCESESIECGPLDDGCGDQLDCGGCGEDSCIAGECLTLECGDTPANACGGCYELTASVGDVCPCGTIASSCDEFGRLICDDGSDFDTPTQLPATDDSVDEFSTIEGTLEGGPAGETRRDFDVYVVDVDDTIFGILKPAIELDFDIESDFEVCVSYRLDGGALVIPNTFLTCESGDQSDTKVNECCLTFAGGSGTLEMSVSMNFDVPNFTDGDGTWEFIVSHDFSSEPAQGVCESYSLRYHF